MISSFPQCVVVLAGARINSTAFDGTVQCGNDGNECGVLEEDALSQDGVHDACQVLHAEGLGQPAVKAGRQALPGAVAPSVPG